MNADQAGTICLWKEAYVQICVIVGSDLGGGDLKCLGFSLAGQWDFLLNISS